jgi:hypothetical protein
MSGFVKYPSVFIDSTQYWAGVNMKAIDQSILSLVVRIIDEKTAKNYEVTHRDGKCMEKFLCL